jgi:hypothetical protein
LQKTHFRELTGGYSVAKQFFKGEDRIRFKLTRPHSKIEVLISQMFKSQTGLPSDAFDRHTPVGTTLLDRLDNGVVTA